MASCANCSEAFQCKTDKRGWSDWKRHPITSKLKCGRTSLSVLEEHFTDTLTPRVKSRGKFLCPTCHKLLNDIALYQNAKTLFRARTTEESYLNFKRKRSDSGQDEATSEKRRCTGERTRPQSHKVSTIKTIPTIKK